MVKPVAEKCMADLGEWSAAVRDRDGCCRRCGSEVALVAHHIKPKSLYPELRLSLENGETLCSNCHIEHHRKHGFGGGKRGKRPSTVRRELEAENKQLRQLLAQERADHAALLACLPVWMQQALPTKGRAKP